MVRVSPKFKHTLNLKESFLKKKKGKGSEKQVGRYSLSALIWETWLKELKSTPPNRLSQASGNVFSWPGGRRICAWGWTEVGACFPPLLSWTQANFIQPWAWGEDYIFQIVRFNFQSPHPCHPTQHLTLILPEDPKAQTVTIY